jgi:predicted esterase
MGGAAEGIKQVWLVCHGYGQLAERFIRRFSVIDDGTRLIIAPEGLSRFYISRRSGPHSPEERVGASWMTREDRDSEIGDQVTYLDRVTAKVFGEIDRSRVRFVALGFSQGVAAVCRWASASESPPDEIIAWAGEIPRDLLEARTRDRLARAKLTVVVGTHDPIADPARTKAHKIELDAAGVRYRFIHFDGGHEIDGQVLREIAPGM